MSTPRADSSKFLLRPVIGDLDDLGFAVSVGDVAVRDVGVGVSVCENGLLQLVHNGVVESEGSPFRFAEIQVVCFFFLPGFELCRKMAEVHHDALGSLAQGEKFDDNGFFGVR